MNEPGAVGVNIPPDVTPVPVQLPPDGENPVNVVGSGTLHTVMSDPALTTGRVLTVIVPVAVAGGQPPVVVTV